VHRVSGIAQLGDGLDVVPVAVCFEDVANVEHLAQLEEAVVFVGRVEQYCVAGLAASQHVHVVVHGADDDLMDLGIGIGPKERVHTNQCARRPDNPLPRPLAGAVAAMSGCPFPSEFVGEM